MTNSIIGDHPNSETSVYKYLSMSSFFYLCFYKQLLFTSISRWPDSHEGARFGFLKSAHPSDVHSEKLVSDFYGSSWTLQVEDACHYRDPDERVAAEAELRKQGSAAMWEIYCSGGGVRIKTTIGKIQSLLNGQHDQYELKHSKVVYEPEGSWKKTLESKKLIDKLFIKRISFRHESEYRFILIPKHSLNRTERLHIPISDMYDFIDEITINPATKDREWISRMLYHYAVKISIAEVGNGINQKNGKQYCNISSLYGEISHEL